jgi:MFS family permease
MARKPYTSSGVIRAYIATNALFTLATSLIWAINTVFLMQRGGLTIFEVMLVNTVYVIAQAICEVPTGVVADTIGRKASFLLAVGTIFVSTVLYVLTPILGWGFLGFCVASAIIGLGFTFQTGAVDAWMVDALDFSGWEGPKDRVFAWGQMSFGVAMLVGSLAGGFLGQVNLVIPYLVRAVILVATFVLVAVMIHDSGFEPRALTMSNFGVETKKILDAGVQFGWRSRVVRPLMFTSLLGGIFFMYGFYSWQPYILQILGHNYIWLLGVVQAASSLAMIGGNSLVHRIMREGEARRDPARVLAATVLGVAALAALVGLVAVVFKQPGVVPAAVAITLWLGWSVVFGIQGPVRSSFINDHIPSAQRATVLSLDSLFADAGGAIGQPILGWVSKQLTISAGWLIGSLLVASAAPLYLRSGAAARAEASAGAPPTPVDSRPPTASRNDDMDSQSR